MKIGFSFGRCIRDIVRGEVDIDDVLVIVARTRMPDLEAVEKVISEYMWRQDYLHGLDEVECQRVGAELFESGRVHQARLEGGNPWGMKMAHEDAVWADVVPTTHMDEQVKEAWNHYRFLLNMTSDIPTKEVYGK
jgi:hypothetical protein